MTINEAGIGEPEVKKTLNESDLTMGGSDGSHAKNGKTTGDVRGGWRRFKEGEPGRRFQDLYGWRRENVAGLWNIPVVVVGVVVALAGVLLMVIPGPGLLLFFFGLGIIGTQNLLVARFMDWTERRVRGLVRRFRGTRAE